MVQLLLTHSLGSMVADFTFTIMAAVLLGVTENIGADAAKAVQAAEKAAAAKSVAAPKKAVAKPAVAKSAATTVEKVEEVKEEKEVQVVKPPKKVILRFPASSYSLRKQPWDI